MITLLVLPLILNNIVFIINGINFCCRGVFKFKITFVHLTLVYHHKAYNVKMLLNYFCLFCITPILLRGAIV